MDTGITLNQRLPKKIEEGNRRMLLGMVQTRDLSGWPGKMPQELQETEGTP